MQRDLRAIDFEAGEPDGMIGRQTRAAVRDFQRARGLPADGYPTPAVIARIRGEARETAGQATELGSRGVSSVQKHLNAIGFNAGEPDGILGPQTRDAIEAYQRSEGILVTGNATRELADRLARELAGSGR
jgi:peptidoglycan hydrolase-like protein with peptidoglycan-binding domain